MVTKKLDPVLDGAGVFIINFLLVLLFLGVILKFGFKAYFPIAGEVPFNTLPILPLLLIGILWKRKNIIILDAIYLHFSGKTKYVFDVIFDVAGVVTSVIWAIGSVQLVQRDLKVGQLTGEMFINFAWYHVPFAVCMFIFVIYVVEDFVKLIMRRQPEVLK